MKFIRYSVAFSETIHKIYCFSQILFFICHLKGLKPHSGKSAARISVENLLKYVGEYGN